MPEGHSLNEPQQESFFTAGLALCLISRLHRAVKKMMTAAICLLLLAIPACAGQGDSGPYKVLPAIVRGNLAIFPVVDSHTYDTSKLMTLDEGIRTGQVTITEAGADVGLIRPGQPMPVRRQGAEVNRLVLYNNSNKPLLLLAGEIVTGGKQDRVIGSDRIIPPITGPIDPSVFCVEPGRWVGQSAKFGSMGVQMAQPSVRTPAMAERNQMQVWDNVRSSNARMASSLSSVDAATIAGTSSYAKVFESEPVQKMVAEYGGTESEQAILRDLRSKGAVGVVVAVNGRVLWADVFASTELLAKYWPKLMRSYVAEAMISASMNTAPDLHDAETYMGNLAGGREVTETEPGVYRRTDITGDGYRVFELMSLLPSAGFTVHITKIRDYDENQFDSLPAKRFSVCVGKSTIGNDALYIRRRNDARKATAMELGRIAYNDDSLCSLHHRAIHAGFQDVWGGEADLHIETVDAQEQYVSVHFVKHIFSQRTHE